MIELPLILVAGLLGSSHCIGMCGGFAMLLGMGTKSLKSNLGTQLTYSLGRIFTYSVLGVAAGYFGNRISTGLSSWVNVPAALSILAGGFLLVQGLKAAGVTIWKKESQAAPGGCLAGSFLGSFLRSQRKLDQFLAGLLTGLLPCGLVYGFLSLAGASGNMIYGAMVMIAFGIGTVPLMVMTGISGSLMSLVARQRLLRVAAWCVVVTGVLTIARGAGFLSLPGVNEDPACPFCVQADASQGNE